MWFVLGGSLVAFMFVAADAALESYDLATWVAEILIAFSLVGWFAAYIIGRRGNKVKGVTIEAYDRKVDAYETIEDE